MIKTSCSQQELIVVCNVQGLNLQSRMSPRILGLQQVYVQALYLLKIRSLTVEIDNMGCSQAHALLQNQF